MKLTTKPDLERVRQMWNHYWAGDVLKRPPVVASVVKDGKNSVDVYARRYYNACHKKYDDQLALLDEWLENTLFLAEAIPFFAPDHGPDQFAAIIGGTELKFSKDSMVTNWFEPVVEDWPTFLPKITLEPNNPTWKSLLEYSGILKKHAQGKYLVGICDFHSNADALSALRGPERFCLDFYDYPDLIEDAMRRTRKLYQPVYDGLYAAGGINKTTGSIGWEAFWCEGRFATIQCDFICMVSPEIADKYIIPALEEEASFLDHCVYHFDGTRALPHLDSILAIKRIDVIQWVPGEGQPPMHEWLDVLKKCQEAGKGLVLYGVSLEQIKKISKELHPEGLVYRPTVKTEKEVNEITAWLEKNT